MSLVYWLSKFSQEAMLVELFLIGLIASSYFGYLLLKKRRFGAATKNIPDDVVRAFLAEMISSAEGFKNQLFGSEFKITPGQGLRLAVSHESDADAAAFVAAATAAGGANPAELEALKAQLAAAMSKQDELSKAVATLSGEKAALEAKAAAAPQGAGDAKASAELQDKIAKLEAKLAEYEVIEDDLANLKKYQQENKQLKSQLEALQKGAPAPAPAAIAAPEPVATPPTPAAPEPAAAPAAAAAEPSPIAAAETKLTDEAASAAFEQLVDKVEEVIAPPAPAGASAADPVKEAAAHTAPPVADSPAAAPAAAKAEKSDADLLNEFERMLSS